MPKAKTEFPPDEFDVAVPNGPRSRHRAPTSRARRALPFLLAIVLGSIAAYVLVSALTTGDLPRFGSSSPQVTASGTVTPTVDPDEENGEGSPAPEGEDATSDETTEEGAGEEEEETEEPAAEPDRGTAVRVLNSAGRAGLAGRVRDRLVGAGWSSVEVGNHSGTLPGSTVFYAEDDPVLLATAEALAEELGITLVELDPAEAGATITVVLEIDFQE